jgi:2-polyprenyl-6-methoxyphenol hydroxylase-like FAD-dependent oxidoreductase
MRVLISGAGIAGPTLAYFLSKTKAASHITILEKAPSLLAHGQNVDVAGCAVTIIRRMGLLEKVREFNTTERGTQLVDAEGVAYAQFPIREGSTASFSSEFEILRADLARMLCGTAKGEDGVGFEFGITIIKVLENGKDGVEVELSNGEVRVYDLLVAADGQWSKIRQQCFPDEEVQVVDKDMYAVYYTIPRQPEDSNWWTVYHALQSRIITLRPDPHGAIRAMFTRMPCSEAQRAEWRGALRGNRKLQQELVRREFIDAGWQARRLLGAMEQAPDFYFQAIQQIKMAKWSTSRVVCLGDTAFAPTPLTGMGTSLAIIGAYVLAGELSKLSNGEDLAKGLVAYENTLRPFVEQVQQIPSFFPGAAHPETRWQRWLLQTCLWILSKAATIPQLVNLFSGSKSAEEQDDGFQLPHYPNLD